MCKQQEDVSISRQPHLYPHLRQNLPRNNDRFQALHRKSLRHSLEARVLLVMGFGHQMTEYRNNGREGD